jgi:hypothetical protein
MSTLSSWEALGQLLAEGLDALEVHARVVVPGFGQLGHV